MINWLITRNIPACSCGFPAADKLYRSLERQGGFTTTALCEDTLMMVHTGVFSELWEYLSEMCPNHLQQVDPVSES